jgi:hypothetical protein
MRLPAPVCANVLLLLAVQGFGSPVRAIYPKEQSRVAPRTVQNIPDRLGREPITLWASLKGGHLTFNRNRIKLRRTIAQCGIILLLATPKSGAGFPRNISG